MNAKIMNYKKLSDNKCPMSINIFGANNDTKM